MSQCLTKRCGKLWSLVENTDDRSSQAVPVIQELPEFKALEDDDGRRAAFAKFIKRQKVYMHLVLKAQN